MTLYSLLLSLSGLSQREAADFHRVRPDTVKSWSAGRNPAPAGIISEMRRLIRRQRAAADELLRAMTAVPPDAGVELGLAAGDAEARRPPLGWPCRSAQARALGLAAAMTDRIVEIVPRGATPATAGAVEAHERR